MREGREERRRELTRLGLVFALDLEDVKEVCGRGVDLDEVLVRARGRVRDGGDGEVSGPLYFRLERERQ